MKRIGYAVWLVFLLPVLAPAQVDPIKRDLVQFGFNQAMEGHAPFSGYMFYYHNQPDFLRTNQTLRLAVAPTYLDSELAFVNVLPNTDIGIGAAGGGFADSYNEIHDGTYYQNESFSGSGGELSASLYHLFNPQSKIPLSYVLRGTGRYIFFDRDDKTAKNFELPNDHADFSVRTGLRWGGVEPTLFPPLAMELSLWYEGHFRTASGSYGFDGDRELNTQSHLFWATAALCYTLEKSQQNFAVRITAGTSVDADRFSAYRLGGFLPLVAEFPLSLPGYYYQEISARQFALLNASYILPLDKKKVWNVGLNAATAAVDYLPGEEQPGNWLSGVGGGVMYRSASGRFKCMVSYGYGIDAMRSHGRGASSIGLLLQIDLSNLGEGAPSVKNPFQWRGWQKIFTQ